MIKIIALISTKFCTMTITTNYSSWLEHNTSITNPRWRMAAIMKKIVISQQQPDQSLWNLVKWRTLTLRTVSAFKHYIVLPVKNYNPPCDAAFCQNLFFNHLVDFGTVTGEIVKWRRQNPPHIWTKFVSLRLRDTFHDYNCKALRKLIGS